jgi:hypothetical protein
MGLLDGGFGLGGIGGWLAGDGGCWWGMGNRGWELEGWEWGRQVGFGVDGVVM